MALAAQEFTNKARERAGAVCGGRKQFFLPWLQHPFLPLLSPGAEVEN